MTRRGLAPLLVGLSLPLVLLAACGGSPEATDLWEHAVVRTAKERGELVVALEAEFRPWEYVDTSGEIVGFDVDLAREIGQALGVPVRFRNVKWDTIIAELVTGKADLIISGMTATPERALSVSYTEPYFLTETCLLVSKARGEGVRSVADLDREGRIVVAKQGTTGEEAARRRCPKARLVTYGTENAAALEVAQGRADAFLYDLLSIEAHHAQHPDTTFVIRQPVTVEPYAIALRKGDPESVAWLNLVLDTLRRTGRMEELYAKHGLVREEGGR
jgi:polar amino acid transport system substrate-binding protein